MSNKNSKLQRLKVSHREGSGQSLILIKIQDKEVSETQRGDLYKQVAVNVVIAVADTTMERGIAQLWKHDAPKAISWDISLSYARVHLKKR